MQHELQLGYSLLPIMFAANWSMLMVRCNVSYSIVYDKVQAVACV